MGAFFAPLSPSAALAPFGRGGPNGRPLGRRRQAFGALSSLPEKPVERAVRPRRREGGFRPDPRTPPTGSSGGGWGGRRPDTRGCNIARSGRRSIGTRPRRGPHAPFGRAEGFPGKPAGAPGHPDMETQPRRQVRVGLRVRPQPAFQQAPDGRQVSAGIGGFQLQVRARGAQPDLDDRSNSEIQCSQPDRSCERDRALRVPASEHPGPLHGHRGEQRPPRQGGPTENLQDGYRRTLLVPLRQPAGEGAGPEFMVKFNRRFRFG